MQRDSCIILKPVQCSDHLDQFYFFYKSKRHCFGKKIKKIVNELQQSSLLDFAGSTKSPRVVTSPIFF